MQRIAHLEGGGPAGLKVRAGGAKERPLKANAKTPLPKFLTKFPKCKFPLVRCGVWGSGVSGPSSSWSVPVPPAPPPQAAMNYALRALEINGRYARWCEWTRRLKFLYVTFVQRSEMTMTWSKVKTWRREKMREGFTDGAPWPQTRPTIGREFRDGWWAQ